MVRVKLVNVVKKFGKVVAVNNASLDVKEGELFTLLGPSGCGKTTTLRLIAGFYKPDEGEIYFDDELVNDVPPHKRNTGMVFQNYALWPHMTVFDNVAYGLKIRNLPPPVIIKRVKEILAFVGLTGKEKRFPSQLSGGEQQRVALARALVIEPKVLLLDEPLSNLDAKLRIRVRSEIRKLQKKLGITTIYVTHDQEEALSISDRVAVMNQGKILQIGTPLEIYDRPSDLFVADFIGTTNFIPCEIIEYNENKHSAIIQIGDIKYVVPTVYDKFKPKMRAICAIRPENIEIYPEDKAPKNKPSIIGKIDLVIFLGKSIRYEVDTDVGLLKVDVAGKSRKSILKEGNKVSLILDPFSIRLLRE